LASAGVALASHLQLFAQTNNKNMAKNIQSRGHAGKDEHGKLGPWRFERRPVGDNDVLIDKSFRVFAIPIFTRSGDIGASSLTRMYPDTKLRASLRQ
jgi:hypothetical protein